MKRFFVGLLLILPLLSACSGSNSGTSPDILTPKETVSDMETGAVSDNTEPVNTEQLQDAEAASELFLLTGIDTVDGTMSLRSVSTGKEESFYYNGATAFFDKYGTMIPLVSYSPGDVVTVSVTDQGMLSEVHLSDEVFQWEDVSDYELDLSRMVFSYGGSNYRIDGNVPVYDNGRDEGIYSLSEGDTLNITGINKDILSITVTTGTGTIALRNIGVFEGGWLNLDSRVYLEISGEMKIPAQEGTHILTVANDGWGDSTVVAVKRGETVAVDLEALKGEGPKYCDLSVVCDVEDAVIRLDGKTIEGGVPSSVRYGVHSLSVTSDGFDPWESRLFVNSKEAEIEVELDPEGTSAAKKEQTEQNIAAAAGQEGAAGSLAGSLANSKASTEGTVTSGSDIRTQREAEQAAAETMLDTMSGMLDTLTGTSLGGND